MWNRLRTLAHSPTLNIAIGLFMVVSAIFEILGDAISELFGGVSLGVGHGLLALGLLHTVKAIPGIAEGVEKIEAARRPAPPE